MADSDMYTVTHANITIQHIYAALTIPRSLLGLLLVLCAIGITCQSESYQKVEVVFNHVTSILQSPYRTLEEAG